MDDCQCSLPVRPLLGDGQLWFPWKYRGGFTIKVTYVKDRIMNKIVLNAGTPSNPRELGVLQGSMSGQDLDTLISAAFCFELFPEMQTPVNTDINGYAVFYHEGRKTLVVPVGKRKLKNLSAARSPQNSCSKASWWPALPSLYDGCASRSTPSNRLPVLQAPLSTGKAPSRAQPCSCHAWDPRRGSTTFFALDASIFPWLPSGPGSAEAPRRGSVLGTTAFAAEGCSPRPLPSPVWAAASRCPHAEESSLLRNSCGNRTARLPSACWRQPRFPSLSGGPMGCAEPQHRLLPAGGPEPAISCPVPKVRVLFLFCFCKPVTAHTQSPQPVSLRGPVAIACAATAGRSPLSPLTQAFCPLML
ncbi:uncharacterized protein LOC116243223 [Phasianus colchicus]|uniref:uncharacterized protein LOC116243223 n=1 Tax=Phasianus colchicus TaxID=9054 RepID=UPI00129EC71F|nr:uncharacterized protein LOC116243223 [Phasianus colchicus]